MRKLQERKLKANFNEIAMIAEKKNTLRPHYVQGVRNHWKCLPYKYNFEGVEPLARLAAVV